jgi:hypothetical protein
MPNTKMTPQGRKGLSDFWEVNKRLVRTPFPIPKISMVLQEIEGFSFATALDLNMGYIGCRYIQNLHHHIDVSRLERYCTNVLLAHLTKVRR